MAKWEDYFETRLLRHANDRVESHKLCYEHLLEKLGGVGAEDVVQLEKNVYSVPSSSSNETYTVQADWGICTCRAGSHGAFCKHQALVQETFGGPFPNSPKLTLQDRLQLSYLALGNRCPPPESSSHWCQHSLVRPVKMQVSVSHWEPQQTHQLTRLAKKRQPAAKCTPQSVVEGEGSKVRQGLARWGQPPSGTPPGPDRPGVSRGEV